MSLSTANTHLSTLCRMVTQLAHPVQILKTLSVKKLSQLSNWIGSISGVSSSTPILRQRNKNLKGILKLNSINHLIITINNIPGFFNDIILRVMFRKWPFTTERLTAYLEIFKTISVICKIALGYYRCS